MEGRPPTNARKIAPRGSKSASSLSLALQVVVRCSRAETVGEKCIEGNRVGLRPQRDRLGHAGLPRQAHGRCDVCACGAVCARLKYSFVFGRFFALLYPNAKKLLRCSLTRGWLPLYAAVAPVGFSPAHLHTQCKAP